MNIDTAMAILKDKISSLVVYDGIKDDTVEFARVAMGLNEDPRNVVLSMGAVKKIIENNNIKTSYLDLVSLLTHPDIDFLQLEYVLVIDDNDEPIDISNDAMADAFRLGYLQNPNNPDQIIYDFNDYIFPTFVINELYIEQKHWRHEC
ncbi:hypothetical protein [Enterobacter sp. H2G27]